MNALQPRQDLLFLSVHDQSIFGLSWGKHSLDGSILGQRRSSKSNDRRHMDRVPPDADAVQHVTIMSGDESDEDNPSVPQSPVELAPVEPWSSIHLSDDDSDNDDEASSSSPSAADEGDDDQALDPVYEDGDVVQSFVSSHESDDENDDWLQDVDVDLPDNDGSLASPTPTTTTTSSSRGGMASSSLMSKLVDSRRLVSPVEVDSTASSSPPVSPSPVRPVEVPSTPSPGRPHQIPRPGLTRQLSLNASGISPPKLLASLERSPSKLLLPPKSPASSPSKRRGMSVSVSSGQLLPEKPPTASSQFWASEQSRRSSRLLDEWKRKEIWHDFKRAEETVLTASPDTASIPSSLGRNPSTSSLDSVLLGVRSNILSKQAPSQSTQQLQQPMRRATSFAMAKQQHIETKNREASVRDEENPDAVPAAEHARVVAQLAAEQEQSCGLHERLLSLENAERENRFLKEEIQSHLMQALSTKELMKTLEDQLTLTARSEEQLKLQTKQLMQQNQSLQAELLDKIAGETAKIQKMAHLAAEKQTLLDDLQREEQQATQRLARVRSSLLRRLLLGRRRQELRLAFADWCEATTLHATSHARALATLDAAAHRMQLKQLAHAFTQFRLQALHVAHSSRARQLSLHVATVESDTRSHARRAAAMMARTLLRARQHRALAQGLHQWRAVTMHASIERQRLVLATTKLEGVLRARLRSRIDHTFARWRVVVADDALRAGAERRLATEQELVEAKDCVFAMSRAKRKLEDAAEAQREEILRANERLREHTQELRLVKHGFVATVLRDAERQWLRCVVASWRAQSREQALAKQHALAIEQVTMEAEAKAQYAQSLNDYNKVLRSDLERCQFLSMDKKVAVDVLAKKLLREEQRRAQLEEQHVLLEHKLQASRAQLSSLVEFDECGTLPVALMHLGRDAVVADLRELVSRLPVGKNDYLMAIVRGAVVVDDPSVTDVEAVIARHAPPTQSPLSVRELVAWLSSIAREVWDGATAPTKQFWSRVLAAGGSLRDVIGVGGTVSGSPGHHQNGMAGSVGEASATPWVVGRLSEEILQNQEKLLAVLEHETAVVERAVMEKSSLKHTYAASESSTVTKDFHEYQCDPVVPPVDGADCQFLATGLDSFVNWAQSGQVQDLFLAFHRPLQSVVRKYSNERQHALPLPGVIRLLEDLRLYPSYVTRTLVHHHFGRLCDRDGLLSPPSLAVFLGCCALELFAASLPTAGAAGVRLSAREIVLSFFCDLGFLLKSDIPPPPFIALVGSEVESVLWPLFEYYANADDVTTAGVSKPLSRRVMTAAAFTKFAAEIVGAATAVAERLFQRVLHDTRRVSNAGSSGETKGAHLHLDDFYIAIAFLQEERSPGVHVANFGEAVRHWMQQTQ